jgi:hypothetical protein
MGRPLSETETRFLAEYFGEALSFDGIRLGTSVGRRCWSPYGNRISLTRDCFEAGDSRAAVRLADPRVAATFAHEAVHVWQRQHNVWVTLRGAALQTGYVLRLSDPYRYAPSEDPDAIFAQFVTGNIERQGRIFQDYVYAQRTGADSSRFTQVVAHVRERKA